MEVEALGRYGIHQQEVLFYLDKYRQAQTYIVVTGEFNAGKTCFINALLGKEDFLPHSNCECTPVLLELVAGAESRMTVKTLDGRENYVEKTRENIGRYAAYRPDYDKSLMSLTIPVDNFCLGERVHLIDTPGTNTINREQEALTDYMISKADLILYMLNKTVSESDILHIKAIRRYTRNMVFIITHTDEQHADGRKFDETDIARLTDTARGQIAAGLETDERDLLIFAAGSKEAYGNPGKMDAIREFLVDYIRENGETRRREQVRRQLQRLFEERLETMGREKEWLETQQSLEFQEREQKMASYLKRRRRMDESLESELLKAGEQVKEAKDLCESRIRRLFQSKTRSLIGEITGSRELTAEQIADRLNLLHEELGDEVKRMIADSAENLLQDAADGLQEQVDQLYEGLGIGQKKPIAAPGGGNGSERRLSADGQQDMEWEIEAARRELAACEEEVAGLRDESGDDREREIRGRLRVLERKYEQSGRKIRDLGGYIPEYDEIVREGGREAGRRAGRIAGELADLALLFWNPGAGAAEVVKTADHAKDWVKCLQIAKNMGEGISKAVPEVNQDFESVSDGGEAHSSDKIKRAVQTRNELINSAQQAGGSQFDNVLDLLSIGYWGEKLGGAVGDAVKPVRRILIEREDVKAGYEADRKKLIDEQEELRTEIGGLELELLEAEDDIGRRTRLKKEVETRKKLLESRVRMLESSAAEQRQLSEVEYIRAYYDREIGGRSSRECDQCCRLVNQFYDLLSQRLAQKIQREYEDRLEELDRMVELLKQGGSGLEKEIGEVGERLEELRGYHEWIDEWVS